MWKYLKIYFLWRRTHSSFPLRSHLVSAVRQVIAVYWKSWATHIKTLCEDETEYVDKHCVLKGTRSQCQVTHPCCICFLLGVMYLSVCTPLHLNPYSWSLILLQLIPYVSVVTIWTNCPNAIKFSRRFPTSRKVTGSNPDERSLDLSQFDCFFQPHYGPGFTQPLTEVSTMNVPGMYRAAGA
jgi:hypothetical protein